MKDRNKVFKLGRFRIQTVIDPPRFALGADLEYDKKYGTLSITLRFGHLWLSVWYNVTAEIIE
jgi:hypothetical protein